MATIKVNLDSVQVTEGQGVGEGDFELRIQAGDGLKTAIWPSLNGSTKVDNNGPAQTIDKEINRYQIASGTVTKTYNIDVTEVDGGTLGKDDTGHGTQSFDLTPGMASTSKSVTISLKRPKMSYLGKVKVTLKAVQI